MVVGTDREVPIISSSGSTVYDPAIASTQVDRERARFDTKAEVSNTISQLESPFGVYDLTTPALASIRGTKVQRYDLRTEFSKRSITGGTWTSGMNLSNTQYASPFTSLPPLPPLPVPLNPDVRASVDFGYRQPVLRGAGAGANSALITVAQIDTEISYYTLKDRLQNLVTSVIGLYWLLVETRVHMWILEQQVVESQFAFERAQSLLDRGQGTAADVAQTRAALARFRVQLIEAESTLVQHELRLRNILGLPPSDGRRMVPVTPLLTQRVDVDWDLLIATAQSQRPDIAQGKLELESAEQKLLLARNLARPSLDLVGVYRFNGLAGTTPTHRQTSTDFGEYTDWSMGIVYEAPLGQRESRADLRRQELDLARQRATLQQDVHNALHRLAESRRRLDQYYEQYLASREARTAARLNLDQQMAEYRRGRTIYLNVLQAITGWGDALSVEAVSLVRYNAELARLDAETGTILETHGIDLVGANYHSRGPLAPLHDGRSYPHSARPTENADRYPAGTTGAEEAFGLDELSATRPAPAP